ncbi:MAG: DUF4406 domain-containing protein [Flexilinea sp.]|nr:DUF4406 domain-containing protein [Flexilinea sp.]
MKRAMICHPMNGISTIEILAVRGKAKRWLIDNGYTVDDTLFEAHSIDPEKIGVQNTGIYYLSNSLRTMSKCDTVYFCRGWNKSRGCQAEHFVAKSYGLHVLYED